MRRRHDRKIPAQGWASSGIFEAVTPRAWRLRDVVSASGHAGDSGRDRHRLPPARNPDQDRVTPGRSPPEGVAVGAGPRRRDPGWWCSARSVRIRRGMRVRHGQHPADPRERFSVRIPARRRSLDHQGRTGGPDRGIREDQTFTRLERPNPSVSHAVRLRLDGEDRVERRRCLGPADLGESDLLEQRLVFADGPLLAFGVE